jgi:heptosyltransferase III
VKILVLQLTRLGDILCTMPTLSALRRTYPEAEIHFLVRKRFASAALVLKPYDHLWQLDARKLLGDFIIGKGSVTDGITRLSETIQQLRSENFDKIINLSFSPSSSFITHLISQNKILTNGYTRTTDFYLAVPDPASGYVRAQVGLDRSNRRHIIDILSDVAQVALVDSDLHPFSIDTKKEGIVCHLGASKDHKVWPTSSWIAFFNRLTQVRNESITLVGSSEDSSLASEILSQIKSDKIINCVGQTDWNQLISILKTSKLFIGADSGPLHAASLAGCKTLNLSVGNVRFWETGPTVKDSRVLRSREPQHLMSDVVFNHAQDILDNGNKYDESAVCTGEAELRYKIYGGTSFEPDAWGTVSWMYFGGPCPRFIGDLPEALKQIEEVADIAVLQVDALKENAEKTEIVGILDNLDEVLEIMRKNIPPISPLLEEFRGNKENIAPGPRNEIFEKTRQCYLDLRGRVSALKSERTSP